LDLSRGQIENRHLLFVTGRGLDDRGVRRIGVFMEIARYARLDLYVGTAGQINRLRTADRQRTRSPLPALPDFPDAAQQIGFDLVELLPGYLPAFAAYLRLEQLLAQRHVVVHLGFRRRGHRSEYPADERRQHNVASAVTAAKRSVRAFAETLSPLPVGFVSARSTCRLAAAGAARRKSVSASLPCCRRSA
jgi:hypothetical protein